MLKFVALKGTYFLSFNVHAQLTAGVTFATTESTGHEYYTQYKDDDDSDGGDG